MKILSNYKDYYDYLQGVYGQDEKIILNRLTIEKLQVGQTRETMNEKPYKLDNLYEAQEFVFCIMGKIFRLVWHKDRFWSYIELEEAGLDRAYIREKGNRQAVHMIVPKNDKRINRWNQDKRPTETTLNDRTGCPIILVHENGHSWTEFPRLDQFNMARYISPEDMWINLYNWLSRVKEEPNTQTDKEKIVSAGFDLKTSFRNM